MAEQPLVEVVGLRKHFVMGGGFMEKRQVLRAVDGVSFSIRRGETLGLVGESGCGKSTTGRTMIRLYEPTDGRMIFDGQDVSRLSERRLGKFRRRVQMIFQDPYASLNPRMKVQDVIAEPLVTHHVGNAAERQERVLDLLQLVGLNRDHANRFPHEFSGGQRQRIGIARALALEPDFLICDEPISALDVSIQAQVVNLLEDLQQRLELTYLFIAHDLSMVKHISNRVAVMYLGKIVEIARADELYAHPMHPYSRALLSAIPIADPDVEARRERIILEGDVPSPVNPPSGCRFRTRCPLATGECAEKEPKLRDVGHDHMVACIKV